MDKNRIWLNHLIGRDQIQLKRNSIEHIPVQGNIWPTTGIYLITIDLWVSEFKSVFQQSIERTTIKRYVRKKNTHGNKLFAKRDFESWMNFKFTSVSWWNHDLNREGCCDFQPSPPCTVITWILSRIRGTWGSDTWPIKCEALSFVFLSSVASIKVKEVSLLFICLFIFKVKRNLTR